MSSRIELTYKKICETCEGVGFGEKIREFSEERACLNCNGSGHTLEKMEFETFDSKYFWTKDHKYHISNTFQPRISLVSARGEGGDVTESINPTLIEFIDEVDCEGCKGMSPISQYDCEICNNTGKIEKVTKYLFKPEEYDAEIRKDGFDEGHETSRIEIRDKIDDVYQSVVSKPTKEGDIIIAQEIAILMNNGMRIAEPTKEDE